MGLYNLDKIFRPGAVAVIGASDKKGTIGNALMRNLTRSGKTQVLPVNP